MEDLKKNLKNMVEMYESIAKTVPILLSENKYIEAKKCLGEYESRYGVCPVCKEHEDIEYGDIDIIDNECFQHCKCSSCS